jgi:hypothetical protein
MIFRTGLDTKVFIDGFLSILAILAAGRTAVPARRFARDKS